MITIRQATQLEFDAVRSFYGKCGYGGGLDESDRVLIAGLETEMIGAVRLCPGDRYFTLRGMQVLPPFQRQKIGTKLLLQCAKQLVNQPCYCIPWAHLRSFYRQAGFQEIESIAAPPELRERFEQYQARGVGVILMGRI